MLAHQQATQVGATSQVGTASQVEAPPRVEQARQFETPLAPVARLTTNRA